MTPKRILIVEDEPTILRMEKRILENAGYSVDAVGCGEDAIDVLRDNKYHLVVADVMMPGIDGFDLSNTIRDEFSKEVPILIVTAIPNPLTMAQKRISEPVSALEKPFTPKSLVSSVQVLEAHAETVRKSMIPQNDSKGKIRCAHGRAE